MQISLISAIANAGESEPAGGGLFSLAIVPLMLVAMYFLIIRPNNKKRREQQQLQSSLSVGDEVMTTGGILGTITGEDGENRFWLEIDNDVQIRIARGGIQGRIDSDADDDVDESDDADDDAAESVETDG